MSARFRYKLIGILSGAILITTTPARADDPLPSWNDTAPKKAIIAFVEKVTKEGSPDFVPPNERIATFDNDGALWAEQPMYFQLAFALDREGKPVGIQSHIGRRPIAAFGNSDGDLQMLQWTMAGAALVLPCSCIMTTRNASGPTTVNRTSGSWTRPGTKRRPEAGQLSA
jgi:hypothetical protein